jgi:hypothetical protein
VGAGLKRARAALLRASSIACCLLPAAGLCGCQAAPTTTDRPGALVADIADISTPPRSTAEDVPFADVFAPLDGRWKGEFKIYVDTRGQPEERPKALDPAAFERPPYKLSQAIAVEQEYTSESPYFQRVLIRDSYPEAGGVKVVESRGVNKVEGGKLWCVVKKPDDTVIHQGALDAGAIVWQRDRKSPLAIEYFRETVEGGAYTIVGWGYYGRDDPKKGPRTYFYARYTRP